MTEIDILLPSHMRRWQIVLADRLRAGGHDVRSIVTSATDAWPTLLEAVLAAERSFSRCDDRLSKRVDCKVEPASAARSDALRIDLSGRAPESDALSLRFDASLSAAAAAIAL
ncbi:MAG: hypothetical protein ACTHJY_23960, partial [Rhizobiaceae bacterium]